MIVTTKFLKNGYIIHNASQISVEINEEVKLMDVENMDEFVSQLQVEGNATQEVPQIITRRQFKIALAVLGKNENDILNGISQLPEPTRTIATISYTEAGTFERSNPELIFVGKTFLQMTDEQIDNIFIVGSQY
jgi:nitrate/nitrite-specific signal transduction histidine kinase